MASKDTDKQFHEDDLIIPIYVDTNALLDVVASIEGGFSVVDKITSHTVNSKTSDQTVNASGGSEFGIPNALSLIKVNLGGALSWKQNRENSEDYVSERYHTYGSLFQRLRYALKTQHVMTHQGLFKTFDSQPVTWDAITLHTFIEVQGKFLPNPLTDSMGTINGLLNFMEVFASSDSGRDAKSTGKKPQLVLPQQSIISIDPSIFQQIKQMKTIIQGLLDNLEKQDICTVLVEIPSATDKYKVVVLLFTEYLRDKSLTELMYKEYKLFGKVVSKIPDATSSIDLLQGTSLNGLNETFIANMLSAFNQPNSGIKLPPAETKIIGPALQIVPIAIYM
jgi:hypothetical protein